ncbi:MAG TPA: PH domain-containing protein [Caulobacteraceae bacterium]|nr:PH domain-containing protein [Caulobacteraceae bacterium]
MGYVEKVLQPGEQISYHGRLHWVVYLSGVLVVLLAAAIAIGAVILVADVAMRNVFVLGAAVFLALGLYQLARAWIACVNTEIIVTNRRIIFKTGFISRSSIEMNLDKVESVVVRQGIAGRLFDFGTLVIRGVGAGLEPVANVAAPLEFHKHVNAAAG